jgi:hypothetical protein
MWLVSGDLLSPCLLGNELVMLRLRVIALGHDISEPNHRRRGVHERLILSTNIAHNKHSSCLARIVLGELDVTLRDAERRQLLLHLRAGGE